jgi:hypothetical protein
MSKEFQQSEVTLRFVKCFEHLLKHEKVRSQRQFALAIDYQAQSMSEVINGRRDVTIEVCLKAVAVWKFNPVFLFMGKSTMLTDGDPDELHVLSVVTDLAGSERIVHVPTPAQAGYIADMGNPAFMKKLPTFSLPNHSSEQTYRCFDVLGDSMEPTLLDKDQVVCTFVEPSLWAVSLKNMQVYVVITKGDVVVKRIHVLPRERRGIELISDNGFYPNQYISFADVREIWHVRTKISPFLHTPPSYNPDLRDLRIQIVQMEQLTSDLRDMIRELNQK